MKNVEQVWLSIDAISTQLGIPKNLIRNMARKKELVRIGNGPSERYLDPTPEYKERLRLCESLYSKRVDVPTNLETCGLMTLREIAEVMGWEIKRTQKYIAKKKIPSIKAKRGVGLYSVSDVRDMIWKRQGRTMAKQRAPFLWSDIINYFARYMQGQESLMPTDQQFIEDDKLRSRVELMMRMEEPEKSKAVKKFMEDNDLTRRLFDEMRRHTPSEDSLSDGL